MSFANETIVLLGCHPQVTVQIGEQTPNGELFFRITSTDPGAMTDIQGLYLNLNTPDEDINSNDPLFVSSTVTNEMITDVATGPNAINSNSEGEALRDEYDVRIEFGTPDDATPLTTLTIVTNPGLTIEDIDLQNMAVVVGTPDKGDQVLLPEGSQGHVVSYEKHVESEDFDHIHDPDDSDIIKSDGKWEVKKDQLMTDGNDDGHLVFEEFDTDGPAKFSIDAKARNLDEFENSGRYEDTLTVEVRIDGGDWQLLDEFRVNDAGDALVGSETGQEIDHRWDTLEYSGGILDSAEDSVQFRMVSDISANNEKIYFDNVEIHTTKEVEDPTQPGGEEIHVDFNALDAGDVVSDQFDGVTISGQRVGESESSENDAMIFDSNNPTGGDRDLGYDDQGNILIISEDNDSSDPDDEAHGGTLSFAFDDPSEVLSLSVLDIEEEDGFIDLFDVDGELIDSIAIPLTGNNGAAEVDINAENVSLMTVSLAGSGAVDDLKFVPPSDEKICKDQYELGDLGGLPILPVEVAEHTIPDDDDDDDDDDDYC